MTAIYNRGLGGKKKYEGDFLRVFVPDQATRTTLQLMVTDSPPGLTELSERPPTPPTTSISTKHLLQDSPIPRPRFATPVPRSTMLSGPLSHSPSPPDSPQQDDPGRYYSMQAILSSLQAHSPSKESQRHQEDRPTDSDSRRTSQSDDNDEDTDESIDGPYATIHPADSSMWANAVRPGHRSLYSSSSLFPFSFVLSSSLDSVFGLQTSRCRLLEQGWRMDMFQMYSDGLGVLSPHTSHTKNPKERPRPTSEGRKPTSSTRPRPVQSSSVRYRAPPPTSTKPHSEVRYA